MLQEIILLVLGLILLVKGSDFFVKSAASIAKRFGVSEFIIGLTLVAIGTSLPELVSAVIASIKRESGIIIGNIVGANIANIALIIGIAAVISTLKTEKEMLERDGYLMLFSSILFLIFIIDGKFSRAEGIIFLLIFIAYSLYLFEVRSEYEKRFSKFAKYFFKFEYLKSIKGRIISNFNNKAIKKKPIERSAVVKDLSILIISGLFVVIGANYLVEEAVFFANFFKVPQTIIGILMALGTTMPEMSVAVTAARKGLSNIVIGNAIGSCITNMFLILGVASLISPITVIKLTLFYTVPFLIFLGILLLIFIKSDWEIRRLEGVIFLLLYAIFITLIFFL